MDLPQPQPPYIWPEPRIFEKICDYKQYPPINEIALASNALFGIVSAISNQGIDAISSWMQDNSNLKACLIVAVYPTCETRQSDLLRLLDLVNHLSGRLSIRIHTLERTTYRATNVLCFLSSKLYTNYFVTGSIDDLGLAHNHDCHVNFVFKADLALTEVSKAYFDWLWTKSMSITARGVSYIPELTLPKGTEEAARLWRAYMNDCTDQGLFCSEESLVAHIDRDTGSVSITTESGKDVISPTEEQGFSKFDLIAHRMSMLYERGSLISINKSSRIPPLDAPLDPKLFGDDSETRRGSIMRKVSMRVSVISADDLKEIERSRQGVRQLLSKFTYGLADNIRWMPEIAHDMFMSEIDRLNKEGQKQISGLFNGNVDEYIACNRQKLVQDINNMYQTRGGSGNVADNVIEEIVASLKSRLEKASSANFMPELTFSSITFQKTNNDFASPWGQAFTLLSDIITFPRKVLTDAYFMRGISIHEEDLIEVMNVADDALCRDLRVRGIRERAKDEIDLIGKIEKSQLGSKCKCELAWRIIDGNDVELVADAFYKAVNFKEKEDGNFSAQIKKSAQAVSLYE